MLQTKKMRGEDPSAYSLRPSGATETLALISLLGIEKGQCARMVEAAQRQLLQFDRLVFVITANDLVDATRGGALVETLPGPMEVANKSPDAIRRYVSARVEQIQRKWQPDFIFQYGLDEKTYIGNLIDGSSGPEGRIF